MLSLSHPKPRVRPTGPLGPEDLAWREVLREAIRDPGELCRVLGLDPALADGEAMEGFSLLVPRGFVARMQPGNPADPLLRQVLPTRAETLASSLPADAVGDLPAQREKGLIHKYEGRVLLVLAGQCAVNCRYCFRRQFPYGDLPRGDDAWEPSLRLIEADPTITEVILSGGDPLVVSDTRLQRLVDRLGAIPHVARLRIHTRLPVVIPERVTEWLCQMLNQSRLQVIVVTHINHANEIDEPVASAIDRLRCAGSLLLNQSVLLSGVNDTIEDLTRLSERLIEVGVLPYYLHQLDLVPGVQHFEVPRQLGERLVAAMRDRLPGYAVPRYVQEQPGRPSKTLLA